MTVHSSNTLNLDLAVAGGGIMGLACALEAAIRGRRVAVFAPRSITGAAEGSASWAAAGILVTRDARVFHSPFREFYVRSIHSYPAWLDRLAALTSRKVPLHRHGDYLVFDLDTPGAQAQLDARRSQWDREHARAYTESEELPAFLRDHSPLERVRVFHFPGEAYVQNRDLLETLRAACEGQGVQFVETTLRGPWEHKAGFTEGQTATGAFRARQVLVAAGTWTAPLLESLGITAPLVPVKGQMIRIPRFHSSPSLVHYGEEIYLVPRGDTLIVGATTEPGVWRDGYDEVGEAYIGRHLARFLPEVAKSPVEAWSGLRPRTRDRLPWMGWLDASRGWALCAGHYKCGISMAPLAAESMVSLLEGNRPPVDLQAFDPWRKKGLKK